MTTNTLVRCDARKGLSETRSGSVTIKSTDPPYKAISGGNSGIDRPAGMLSSNDGKIMKYNDIDVSEYAHEMFRVLRSPSHCYVMTNVLNVWAMHVAFTDAGFKLHNLLVWGKNTMTPNRWYMKNVEYTLFLRKGKAFTINNPGDKTMTLFKNATGNRDHPTQKPVDLMKMYVLNSSSKGQSVMDPFMDPFMGSGTTGVAAQSVGRDFTGFEIDPEYYVKACHRMKVMP